MLQCLILQIIQTERYKEFSSNFDDFERFVRHHSDVRLAAAAVPQLPESNQSTLRQQSDSSLLENLTADPISQLCVTKLSTHSLYLTKLYVTQSFAIASSLISHIQGNPPKPFKQCVLLSSDCPQDIRLLLDRHQPQTVRQLSHSYPATIRQLLRSCPKADKQLSGSCQQLSGSFWQPSEA